MQRFDLVVLGSGNAAAFLDEQFADWSIALVDCEAAFGSGVRAWNCSPSQLVALAAESQPAVGGEGDWTQLRERVLGYQEQVSDKAQQRLAKLANLTRLSGAARFVGPHHLTVGNDTIAADQIVIAVGSRPKLLPEVVSEEAVDLVYDTSSIVELAELPRRLVILGGGASGCEYAQVFASLGSEVTILESEQRLLPSEDAAVAGHVTDEMARLAQVRLNQRILTIEGDGNEGLHIVATDRNQVDYDYLADAVLVAAGRERNSDQLELAVAGVKTDAEARIAVDACQRTSVPHIWAVGDVTNSRPLGHFTAAETRALRHNLLHPHTPIEVSHRDVPRVTYCRPTVAKVGVSQAELDGYGASYLLGESDVAAVASDLSAPEQRHVVKLLADPEHLQLLGAHVVGPQAAVLIQLLSQAMAFSQSAPDIVHGQHWVRPGVSEAIEAALLDLVAKSQASS